MNMQQPKYRRVLLKLSGEALAKGADGIINREFVKEISDVLKRCLSEGAEIAIIVGAGNIWRGRQGVDMDPTRADSMGMLATTINALALEDAFIHFGIDAHAMTAVEMPRFAEPYVRDRAYPLPFYRYGRCGTCGGDRCGYRSNGEKHRCDLYGRSPQGSECRSLRKDQLSRDPGQAAEGPRLHRDCVLHGSRDPRSCLRSFRPREHLSCCDG